MAEFLTDPRVFRALRSTGAPCGDPCTETLGRELVNRVSREFRCQCGNVFRQMSSTPETIALTNKGISGGIPGHRRVAVIFQKVCWSRNKALTWLGKAGIRVPALLEKSSCLVVPQHQCGAQVPRTWIQIEKGVLVELAELPDPELAALTRREDLVPAHVCQVAKWAVDEAECGPPIEGPVHVRGRLLVSGTEDEHEVDVLCDSGEIDIVCAEAQGHAHELHFVAKSEGPCLVQYSSEEGSSSGPGKHVHVFEGTVTRVLDQEQGG